MLLDVVGTGGMGTVHRAWDLQDQRLVAVKSVRHADDPSLTRFAREQSLGVDHPHVAAPGGWVGTPGGGAFAVGLATGGTLHDLLAELGPLAPRVVVDLLDQILAGLEALHAAGVVHRDVKPANLLLDASPGGRPHVYVADLGVAGLLGDPAPVGEGPGTPGYAAPEQLAGAAPDVRQDLHAVGVVGLELLGLVSAGGSLEPAPGAPDRLVDLLLACACDDPAARPPTADLVRDALTRCGPYPPSPYPVVPDRLGPVEVPVPVARRRLT